MMMIYKNRKKRNKKNQKEENQKQENSYLAEIKHKMKSMIT
jgi:large-conductance mechanosensitive channel